MTGKTVVLTDRLHEYLRSVSLREPELLKRLREETARDDMSRMQIAPEQGQFMAWLVELMGAQRAVEVGVYTGYSSLCIAGAMGEQGRLIACDLSEQWTAVARRYWREAGIAERIDLRIAPALDTLDELLGSGYAGTQDLVFIDADKTNYDRYYEKALQLLRPGGIALIDNVLWSGRVADPDAHDEDTEAIRALNAKIHGDERVSLSMLPLADGLTLVRKRG
jgi:predicted O-methyltransferase YrrM